MKSRFWIILGLIACGLFVKSLTAAPDLVQIANNGDLVSIANQKIEISTGSFFLVIATNGVTFGDGTTQTTAFTGGGGDPTVITTFTKTFSIGGDIVISTFTFDPLDTGWDIGNGTITIIGVSFKAKSSSVSATSVGIMLATGGATSVYSSIHPSSFTIGTSATYNFIASSWVAPTTAIIYPGSRLAIHVSNAPVSGDAPKQGKVMIEYYVWKKI